MTRLGEFLTFGYFLLKYFKNFTQISSFKTQFFVLTLTFNSSLVQLFLTFNLSFCNLATVLATFPKIGQLFFKVLVTLARKDKQSGLFGLFVSDKEKKSFITSTTGVYCPKHVLSSLTYRQNKLECFVLAKLFQWSLIF